MTGIRNKNADEIALKLKRKCDSLASKAGYNVVIESGEERDEMTLVEFVARGVAYNAINDMQAETGQTVTVTIENEEGQIYVKEVVPVAKSIVPVNIPMRENEFGTFADARVVKAEAELGHLKEFNSYKEKVITSDIEKTVMIGSLNAKIESLKDKHEDAIKQLKDNQEREIKELNKENERLKGLIIKYKGLYKAKKELAQNHESTIKKIDPFAKGMDMLQGVLMTQPLLPTILASGYLPEKIGQSVLQYAEALGGFGEKEQPLASVENVYPEEIQNFVNWLMMLRGKKQQEYVSLMTVLTAIPPHVELFNYFVRVHNLYFEDKQQLQFMFNPPQNETATDEFSD